MTIKKGDIVKVDYVGTLDDGTIFDSSNHGNHSHPLKFAAGSGDLIRGFDEVVIGMDVGEEKSITIKPEDAYGSWDPERILDLPNSGLPKEAQPGAMLMLSTPKGERIPGQIVSINTQIVKIDFNHPLAGKTLNFKIKVVSTGDEKGEGVEEDIEHDEEKSGKNY